MSSAKISKSKKILMLLLKIAISIGIITYIFNTQVDYAQVFGYFKTADLSMLFLAKSLFIVLLVLCFVRWDILLKTQDIIVSCFNLTRIYCISLFFNIFMFGLNGGDVVKIYYIAKQSKDKVTAGTTVVIDRIIGLAALLTVVFIGILFMRNDPKVSDVFMPVVVTFICMFAFGFCFSSKRIMKRVPFLKKILEVMPFKEKIYEVYNTYYRYRSYKKKMFWIIAISLLVHPCIAMMNYFLGIAIGITTVPIYYFFILIPIICLISALPISVAGWGVGEALYISLFSPFGVAPAQAVSLSILNKLFYLIVGVVCSIAYVVPEKRTMT